MTCEACKDKFSGRPCRFCSPLPAGLDTLEVLADATQAVVAAIGKREFSELDQEYYCDAAKAVLRVVDAQVAALIAQAREEAICEERRHTQTTIDQTRAEYAPLVALVRRFQETVAVVKAEVGTPLTDEVHVHGREYAEAHAALEAFDLGKEGDK